MKQIVIFFAIAATVPSVRLFRSVLRVLILQKSSAIADTAPTKVFSWALLYETSPN